jgi:MoaA/NifB/PqqE/SkfB family radical SAM enzyme
MGGEITLWPRFFDLIKFFKTRYDCIFTLTTNGSRDLQFWEEAAECLDYVILSTHHQYANTTHLQQVGDLLYKKNVIVTAIVLMDPFAWDKCIKIVNDLQHSKYSWSIRYLEVIHKTIEYTVEQKKILNKLRARRANILWFLRNNKSYKSSVTVVDENNKKHKLGDQTLVIERMNNFKGWQCSLGVNWIAVKTDGTVSGICGNGLYKDSSKFNIFNENFIETFKPTIEHTICQTDVCWCIFETNMPKKRIIPIYAN